MKRFFWKREWKKRLNYIVKRFIQWGVKHQLSWPKWRKGNTFSRVCRLFFERKETKKALGFGLAFLMVFSFPFNSLLDYSVKAESKQQIIIPHQEIVTTKTSFQKPVEGVISQGFHWYHQAVDIADNQGLPVKPVAVGKVVETGYQFFGYGNFVVVSHGEDWLSLYAHLEKIEVEVGQEVKQETILGTVGSTGRSTGAHLHLEIIEEGENLNPFAVIEDL